VITEDKNSDEVFRLAAQQRIIKSNLGGLAEVSVDGYHYRVLVYDKYLAEIDYREKWGNVESMHIIATPEQDRALRTQYWRTR
jgi:hypothetical protein